MRVFSTISLICCLDVMHIILKKRTNVTLENLIKDIVGSYSYSFSNALIFQIFNSYSNLKDHESDFETAVF